MVTESVQEQSEVHEDPVISEMPQLEENSYDEAYKSMSNPESYSWPNDAYRDFIKLIVHYHISDNIANAFIQFFNKHANLKKSPLPSSMKQAKDSLKQATVPNADFRKEAIPISPDQECYFYYRPIINAVKSLLALASINENLVLEYNEIYQNGERIYEEQFNSN